MLQDYHSIIGKECQVKNSEKVKAAICNITNDMDMEQDTKFEVVEFLYWTYMQEKQRERMDRIRNGNQNNHWHH